MLVNIEKETGKNLILRESLEDTPIDLLLAYNYSLYILSLKRNLPDEYFPKKWQLYFEDEIQSCVKKYLDSLKVPREKKTFEEPTIKENVLAEEMKEWVEKARRESG